MTPTNLVEKVAADEYRIMTAIAIDAPRDVVWSTLTDWDQLASWSSSFVGLEGNFAAGGHVIVTFKILGTTQRPEHDLIDFEKGVQFGWSDPVLMGMVDHHMFRVETFDENRTLFLQNDRLKGGATRVLGRLLAGRLRSMYEQFNGELKVEAERRHLK